MIVSFLSLYLMKGYSFLYVFFFEGKITGDISKRHERKKKQREHDGLGTTYRGHRSLCRIDESGGGKYFTEIRDHSAVSITGL